MLPFSPNLDISWNKWHFSVREVQFRDDLEKKQFPVFFLLNLRAGFRYHEELVIPHGLYNSLRPDQRAEILLPILLTAFTTLKASGLIRAQPDFWCTNDSDMAIALTNTLSTLDIKRQLCTVHTECETIRGLTDRRWTEIKDRVPTSIALKWWNGDLWSNYVPKPEVGIEHTSTIQPMQEI